jgi:hypothetical protein
VASREWSIREARIALSRLKTDHPDAYEAVIRQAAREAGLRVLSEDQALDALAAIGRAEDHSRTVLGPRLIDPDTLAALRGEEVQSDGDDA